MSIFLGEFAGTALLITFGAGVVANVVLPKTNGNNSGWIVITFGWAMAVFAGVYAATYLGSGGHLNPAVTVAMLYLGNIKSEVVIPYLGGQFAGAMAGAVITWLAYKKHFDEAPAGSTLGIFSTGGAIRNPFFNTLTEAIGTFVLIFGVLVMPKTTTDLGTLNALPVALLVLAIGLSLGGPTGYAINPARDLGPRIIHAILPIKNKGGSDWGYAWVPVIGPIIGALLAAVVFKMI